LGIALALVCLAPACGSGGGGTASQEPTGDTIGDEGEAVDGGSLVVGISQETSGWNPTFDRWANMGALVGSSVLEPLATLDGDGVAQPFLATEWVPNDDFTSWTLTLRDGVKFHDGTSFDADAAKKSIDGAINGVLSGVALAGLFDEVTVVDDHTLQIDLLVPWAAFPSSFLAGQSALMKAPAMIDSGAEGSLHPIGTGPFVFDSWEPDNSFVAVKFEDYWQEGLPHLDRIEFRVLPDDSTRASSLETGDLDMILTGNASDAANLDPDYTVVKNWETEPAMLMTNVRPEMRGESNPMSNKHARLALAYATDRAAIAAAIGEGVDTPTSPFAPNSPWGAPIEDNGYPSFDPDKAREEVQAYLDDTGESELRVTISGEGDVNTVTTLQQVQQQWEDVGIKAEIEALDTTALIQHVVAGAYQLAFFRIYSSPDPDQNYYFWGSATAKAEGEVSINFTGLTSPAMDDALERGRESGDFEARYAAYQDLVHDINEEAVNIWLYWTPYSLIADARVHGLADASQIEFGNFQPKTWLGELWID
jgi:peptide/nickel transport system substrate-binding protein